MVIWKVSYDFPSTGLAACDHMDTASIFLGENARYADCGWMVGWLTNRLDPFVSRSYHKVGKRQAL